MQHHELKCLRCLGKWTRKKFGRAAQCPHCHSVFWDIPRKRPKNNPANRHKNLERFREIMLQKKLSLADIGRVIKKSYQMIWQYSQGLSPIPDDFLAEMETLGDEMVDYASPPVDPQRLRGTEFCISCTMVGGLAKMAEIMGVDEAKLMPYYTRKLPISEEQLEAIRFEIQKRWNLDSGFKF